MSIVPMIELVAVDVRIGELDLGAEARAVADA